jgi:hypothetical protein
VTPPHSEPRPSPSTDLGTGPSLFLDIVRLLAALMVALGHLTQVSNGWGSLIDLAVNAVTAFFLLSGFVIRYVTVRRRGSLPNYIADRASRIYSVLLPAMLLATFTDIAVKHFTEHTSGLASVDFPHLAIAAFTNLTFTTYIWHMHWGYYTDGAMWSLCFEWAYYMLYGLAFYLTGWRRILTLLVIALIAGPEVLTLFPIWLAGCLLFEVFIRVRTRRWFLPTAIPPVCSSFTVSGPTPTISASASPTSFTTGSPTARPPALLFSSSPPNSATTARSPSMLTSGAPSSSSSCSSACSSPTASPSTPRASPRAPSACSPKPPFPST